ncbi:hypothetical protein AbraIFM66951_008728 [Aspergillus brasiliensis]|uniref:Zn(2)-C6 fungal-type domain-containing protein n=1 Tax=Aspergillus brasiliensis TaxID=319629 RepID=A0A9W5YQ03_9EURO|nr:hypothetical protein AbraCBS73388_007723 [Aspergillus brasiliensis]GKZ45860.1 hypothetical protein AbraIFM66951_008728 [Aspergillus brasiliensis]
MSQSPQIVPPTAHGSSASACLVCRQRKTKCDRQRPTCSFCQKYDLDCAYTPPRKSGLRAGYVSHLEQRIAQLETQFKCFQQEVWRCIPQLSADVVPSPFLETDERASSLPGVPEVPQSTSQVPSGDSISGSLAQGGDFAVDSGNPPGLVAEHLELTQAMAVEYCAIWFEKYHPWFPILHQPSLVEYCQRWGSSTGANSLRTRLQAMAAVILSDPSLDAKSTAAQRRQWSDKFRREVLVSAMHDLCMENLQALLIVSIAKYGDGNLSEFWNQMALCKRMGTQLGLRDLVTYNCQNFGVPSSQAPPRMLSVPATAIELEEKIRAFWAAEALDSVSTLGVAWNLGVSKPELAANLPCSDDIWGFPESLIAMYRFGGADSPSCFSLFVRLVTRDLWHVHHFLQQSYYSQPSTSDAAAGELHSNSRRSDCMRVDEQLLEWQQDFQRLLTVNTPPYTDLYSYLSTTNDSSPAQHPNTILIQCTVDSAIISLYQRYLIPVAPPSGETVAREEGDGDGAPQPWKHAADRCQQSCNHMAEVLRNASDAILGNINPLIIYSIFNAGRFSIAYHHRIGTEIPSKTHFLVYALTVCGQRWPLARQLRHVLDAAMWGRSTLSSTANPLPAEFYDLQYHALDIAEALRQWYAAVESVLPPQ